jgi:hypothetical protein
MGTQSILVKNEKSYAKDFEHKLLKYSDDFFIKKNFLMGNGVDIDKLRHAMVFNRLLSAPSCKLIDFINDKISGKLDEVTKTKRKKRVLTESLLSILREEIKDHTDSEILNDCCGWDSVEW